MKPLPSETEKHVFELLGLSKNEQKVLKCTEKSPKSMSAMTVLTGIPRSSIPYIVKGLKTRSLLKTCRMYEDQKRDRWLSNLDKAIRALHMPVDHDIEVYRGADEIYSIFVDLVSLPKGSRVYGIQPDNSIHHALRKNSVKKWLAIDNLIKTNKYVFEGIVHEKSVETVIKELGPKHAKQIFDSFIGRLEDYVKIPAEFANVEAEIYIFGGSAYMLNWNKEIAIGIHDKDMVDLLLAMFSCVKELGTRYSQNKRMEFFKDILDRKTVTPPNKPL